MVYTQQVNNPPQRHYYNPHYNNGINYAAPIAAQQLYNYSVPNNAQVQRPDQFSMSQQLINKRYAVQLKSKGNEFRLQGQFDKAIEFYEKALQYDPNYTDVLYNLGRTYRDTGKINQAINTFNKLLAINPNDFESRTLLGEFYEDAGSIDNALAEYKKVLQVEPNYDYARRNLQSARVKKIALTNPKYADQIIQQAAKDNLEKALKLIQEKAPPYITANLQGLTIAFGLTEEVNKYENLAQYENSNKRILISNKLVFASPNVIATYLVHEAVHGGDRDPITSIREEQDAFREMTKFWIETNNGIIDPDLTLAMNLYLQHPDKLDAKVENLYVKRDPNIRKTSPNHGEPSNNGSLLDTLYDKLRSMLPAQSFYNIPNQVRDAYSAMPGQFSSAFSPNTNPFYHIPGSQYILGNPVETGYSPDYSNYYPEYYPQAGANPNIYNIPTLEQYYRMVPANMGLNNSIR